MDLRLDLREEGKSGQLKPQEKTPPFLTFQPLYNFSGPISLVAFCRKSQVPERDSTWLAGNSQPTLRTFLIGALNSRILFIGALDSRILFIGADPFLLAEASGTEASPQDLHIYIDTHT